MTLCITPTPLPHGGLLMAVTAHEAGEKLAYYLRRAGMQQKELAAAINVEASYISRMVKGHINWTTGQYFGKIASLLRLRDDEIKALNLAAVVEVTSAGPEPLPPLIDEVPIPDELVKAGELYKDLDPLIAKREVQLQLAHAGFFGAGPRTAAEWFSYFMAVRQWIK